MNEFKIFCAAKAQRVGKIVKGNNLEIVKRVTVMQGYERKKLSVNSHKTIMWIHSS